VSEQNPYGAAQPPAQPYGAPPPPAPQYGAPQQPWGSVPQQGGAPGYPAPPAPGYPGAYGYAPQPPKKSRRTLWIVLGCIGGVLLLGGGLLGYFILDVASKTGTHKVVLPENFQGMPKDTANPLAAKLESSLQESFSSGKNAWTPTAVSAVYDDKAAGKGVIVFGGYGNVLAPSVQVDEFFSGFEKGAGSKGTTFSGRTTFDAGPLGGTLSCELMKATSETDSLCVWADGSSVVGVLTGQADTKDEPDLAKAAATVRELRQISEIKK